MLELAEVVRELRGEIMRAMAAGEGEVLQFEVGIVDLELTLAVKRESGGKAGIKFYVFELGGDVNVESAKTQKLTLRLNPRMAGSGETPRIVGRAIPSEV